MHGITAVRRKCTVNILDMPTHFPRTSSTALQSSTRLLRDACLMRHNKAFPDGTGC